MRGQIEINFQWIYVLIAGGAFLIIFFLAFRGFTENEEQRINAIGVRAAATSFGSALWQPESARNMSMAADVSCTGNVLTLTRNGENQAVDRTPVFLPPVLSGRVAVHAREVSLSDESAPAISYGNVLYALDQNTYYYYLDEPVDGLTTRRFETPFAEPEGARSIIIVGEDEDFRNVQVPTTRAKVYGVNVLPDKVQFLEFRNAWQLAGEEQYAGREILFGAMVSANATNFACSRNNFMNRARDITSVYVARSQALLGRMRPECVSDHQQAIGILARGELFNSALLLHQESLYRMDCPVIA